MDYSQFVRSRIKPAADILGKLTPDTVEAWHMLLGLTTELGEIGDLFKKQCVTGKPLDAGDLLLELGDFAFYFEGLLQAAGLTLERVRAANIEKLSKRYPDGYSDAAAAARADENGASCSAFNGALH